MSAFQSTIGRFDSDLWDFHFIVPKEIGDQYSDGKDRRVVCTLNGIVEFQCALMPHGDGDYFINVNKKNRDQLKLKVGSPVEVQLEKDKSEYGLPMPEEFREVLNQDPDGDRLFHELTPGKQRTLLYIAGNVKNIDKRIHRALAIVEHLKRNLGKIDYKILNEEIKVR